MESVGTLGKALLTSGILLGLVACSSSKPKPECTTGEASVCECPDGTNGSAACEANGTVGACDCVLGSGGSGGNDDGQGGSAGSDDGGNGGIGGSSADGNAAESSAGGASGGTTGTGGAGASDASGGDGSGNASAGGAAGQGGTSTSGGGASSTGGGGGESGTGGSGGAPDTGGGGSGGNNLEPIVPGQNYNLTYKITDAEYSDELDALVLLTYDPDRVVVLDPDTLAARFVDLPPLRGTTISVAPNGVEAAVGQGSWLSVVNLETLTLDAYIDTTTEADGDVVLAGNGFAYVFPSAGQGFVHEVELATETDHGINDAQIQANVFAKLHPSGTCIYGISGDIRRFDIADGLVDDDIWMPSQSQYDIGPGGWLSKDGELILTGAGTTWIASAGGEDDMTYYASFEDIYPEEFYETRFVTMDHNLGNDSVYAVGMNRSSSASPGARERKLEIYEYEAFTYVDTIDLPPIQTDYGVFNVYGRFVFASQDGTLIYVLAKSESAQLLNDWAFMAFEVE